MPDTPRAHGRVLTLSLVLFVGTLVAALGIAACSPMRSPAPPTPLPTDRATPTPEESLRTSAPAVPENDADYAQAEVAEVTTAPGFHAEYSNIYPEDYVGAAKCAECHEANTALWEHHPHKRMNQHPNSETVQGNFDDQRIRYGPGDILFHRRGDAFLMSLHRDDELVRRFRVTRTVGSRFYQFYIGVQEVGPEKEKHPAYRVETKLPFGFSFLLDRWLPELYFDSYPPKEMDYDDGRSFGEVIFADAPDHEWNRSCVVCHNTVPYALRFRGEAGWRKGFPTDHIGTSSLDPKSQIAAQWGTDLEIEVDELAAVGIECEACHFGGREHAIDGHPISFLPRSPELRIRVPGADGALASDREDPLVVNSVCAQCHSAKVDHYSNGAAQWNSSEALDMAAGDCSSEILCTDCHNPHLAGQPGGSPDRPSTLKACVSCHEEYKSAEFANAHSGHPTSSEVNCLDCHMPKLNQGLETAVRTHRISSPTDRRMLRKGEPNACNLCHLDKSVAWTVEQLNDRWDANLEPSKSWNKAYGGSLEIPTGIAWLRHKNHVVRLIATQAYSESELGATHISLLLPELLNEYAVNRLFGLVAIQKIIGRELTEEEYDLLAPPDVRKQQVARLRGLRPQEK